MVDEGDSKLKLLQQRMTTARELLSKTEKLKEKSSAVNKLIKKIQAELKFLESVSYFKTVFIHVVMQGLS